MSSLDDACAEILRRVPSVAAMAQADEDGTRTHGQPASRPPWNAAVANVDLDLHELVRRLEASLRLAVTGHTGPRRGGSVRNTGAAVRAIASLGNALERDAADLAAALLERQITAALQLTSVDQMPRWERIRPGPDGLPPCCPYCETFSLRVAIASGAVACWYPGCQDSDGNRPPMARMEVGIVSGQPRLVWHDGRVQQP